MLHKVSREEFKKVHAKHLQPELNLAVPHMLHEESHTGFEKVHEGQLQKESGMSIPPRGDGEKPKPAASKPNPRRERDGRVVGCVERVVDM